MTDITPGGDSIDDSELSRFDQAELDAAEPVHLIGKHIERDGLLERLDELTVRTVAALVLRPGEQQQWIRKNITAPDDQLLVAKLFELSHAALTTDDREQLIAGLRALAAPVLDPDGDPESPHD